MTQAQLVPERQPEAEPGSELWPEAELVVHGRRQRSDYLRCDGRPMQTEACLPLSCPPYLQQDA